MGSRNIARFLQPERLWSTRLILIVCAILITWKFLLWIDLPQPGTDPVWYLSQTFSLMRGEWMRSSFGHAPIDPYPLPYMYGLISLPFFSLFPWREISIFVWSILLVGLIVWAAFLLLRRSGTTSTPLILAVLISFLGSPYLYGPRPEVLNILLMLFGIIWINHWSPENLRISGIMGLAGLTAIIGLIQPVGGVFFIFLLSIYSLRHRISLRFIIIYAIALIAILAILYGPIILVDPRHWFTNFFTRFAEVENRGSLSLSYFFKNTIYTPFVYVPLAIVIVRQNKLRVFLVELTILLIAIVVLLPFSRSYYYSYFMVLVIWRISLYASTDFPRWITTMCVLAAPFFTHYWPSVQQLENREYVAVFRAALYTVRDYTPIPAKNRLWVSIAFGMPVINYPESRMYSDYYRTFFGEGIQIRQGDRILAETYYDVETAISLLGPDQTMKDLEVRQIIPPSEKGLLTLTPFMGRSKQVGLWEIRLRQVGQE